MINKIAGVPYYWFKEVASTQTTAKDFCAKGNAGPLWIHGETQLNGRGRLDRVWVSQHGNLYASFLFTPNCPLAQLSQLTFVSALAVHKSLAQLLTTPEELKLKWPNDILLKGAKICGILIETDPAPLVSLKTGVIIGFGINLVSAPRLPNYPTTSLLEHGVDTTPLETLELLATNLQNLLTLWDNGNGFATIRKKWLENALDLGMTININMNNQQLSGIFLGLNENGALRLLAADGKEHHLYAGDVRGPNG